MPEGLDGVKSCGAERGIDAEDESDADGDAQGQKHAGGGDARGHADRLGDNPGDELADADADQSARDGKNHGGGGLVDVMGAEEAAGQHGAADQLQPFLVGADDAQVEGPSAVASLLANLLDGDEGGDLRHGGADEVLLVVEEPVDAHPGADGGVAGLGGGLLRGDDDVSAAEEPYLAEGLLAGEPRTATCPFRERPQLC